MTQVSEGASNRDVYCDALIYLADVSSRIFVSPRGRGLKNTVLRQPGEPATAKHDIVPANIYVL